MKSFIYKITDEQGIHARPAGIIVLEAKKFISNITITNKNNTVDLKRIFSVMGLCVKSNEEVIIEIDGIDEEEAFIKMKKVFEDNL